MSDDSETPDGVEIVADAFNGLVSKATETVILFQTGDPMLAATLGGGAGGATKGLIAGGERLWRERRRKLSLAAVTARDQAPEMTLNQLVEHALNQDDERRLDLLLRAFRRAAQEVDDERVRFYGRIAAAGVLEVDDARVDARDRVFSTIARLSIADLRALVVMARDPDADCYLERDSNLVVGHRRRALDEEFPSLAPALDSVVATLFGQGLLSSRVSSEGGAPTYKVTPFGELCVRELKDEPDAPPGPSPS